MLEIGCPTKPLINVQQSETDSGPVTLSSILEALSIVHDLNYAPFSFKEHEE